MVGKRKILLATMFVFAIVGASMGYSWCESCYTNWIDQAVPGGNPLGYTDAQCCIEGTGHCEMLASAGYQLEKQGLE